MIGQPEALRLADLLERMSLSTRWDKAAANELRRLHELNEELATNLEIAMYRIKDMLEGDDGQAHKEARKWLPRMAQSLVKAGVPKFTDWSEV